MNARTLARTFLGRRIVQFGAVVAVAITSLTMGLMPANASSGLNLAVKSNLGSTGCVAYVGTWMNDNAYPGVGMYVTCSTRHTIQVKGYLYDTNTAGTQSALFVQSPWYTYTNAYATRQFGYMGLACPSGYRAWDAGISVYIDGVQYNTIWNGWHWWTACTFA